MSVSRLFFMGLMRIEDRLELLGSSSSEFLVSSWLPSDVALVSGSLLFLGHELDGVCTGRAESTDAAVLSPIASSSESMDCEFRFWSLPISRLELELTLGLSDLLNDLSSFDWLKRLGGGGTFSCREGCGEVVEG